MRQKIALTLGAVVTCSFVAVVTASWYWDWGHAWVEKLHHLHGQTPETVVAELGEPNTRHEFAMADCCDEFRIELFNVYPPTDPRTAQVRIKEFQWHHRRYHIAVWFHQVNGEWVAVDTCRWKEGIAF
jgi:hypothetical protein